MREELTPMGTRVLMNLNPLRRQTGQVGNCESGKVHRKPTMKRRMRAYQARPSKLEPQQHCATVAQDRAP